MTVLPPFAEKMSYAFTPGDIARRAYPPMTVFRNEVVGEDPLFEGRITTRADRILEKLNDPIKMFFQADSSQVLQRIIEYSMTPLEGLFLLSSNHPLTKRLSDQALREILTKHLSTFTGTLADVIQRAPTFDVEQGFTARLEEIFTQISGCSAEVYQRVTVPQGNSDR
ncbi:hypothetical protein HY214_01715 [Candidatus Roizmanbacteria bacterium]|nr:hypothetical protein [Candidatus Roizmanbacteria bacterium]